MRNFKLNSLKWKRCISKFYPVFFKKMCSRKIILIYHAIGDGPWAVSECAFKSQIQWLKTHVNIVSLPTLLGSQKQKKIIEVALTFDDGYACLYDIVLPILQTEKLTATVYVNTGWMGEVARKDSNVSAGHYPGEKFLMWNEVKQLSQAGWEIGSHGVEHIDLTKQPLSVMKSELLLSKQAIENQLQKKCVHFAYTYGSHVKQLRKAVSDVGYQFAVAGHHAPLKNYDKMMLPRLNIEAGYSIQDFENIILGKWDFLGIIHRVKKWL